MLEGLAQAPAVPPAPLLMESAVESSSVSSTGALPVPKVWTEAGARLRDCRGCAGLTSPQHDGNSMGCAAALQDPAQGSALPVLETRGAG